jgi:hypothetical protein
VAVPRPEGSQPAWIQLEFAQPFRAHAVTIAMGSRTMPRGSVQARVDGGRFVTLAALPGPSHFSLPVRTYAFPETSARFYRVVFTEPVPGPLDALLGAPPVRQYDVAEVELHSEPRLHRWHEKAGFAAMLDPTGMPTPTVSPAAAIRRADVVDLTKRMAIDGRLDWDVPAGRWLVLRLGHSLTGQKNGPAPVEATGYEVNKLSSKHVRAYYRDFLAPVSEATGPLLGKSLQYLLVDSWEAGMQNWSEGILDEFVTRRGYDPRPYLPVLTGRVVESDDVSERFLWDFRRTIADVLADAHYALPAQLLHERGLTLYGEAAGTNSPTLQDALQNKGRVDVPMGEFWTLFSGQRPRARHLTDVREAASAAHVYGKPLVAAESFTSIVPGWNDAPSRLKWGRLLHVAGCEPFRDPHLRAPALPRPQARAHAGPVRPALHAPQHVGRAVARVDRALDARLVHAPAGFVRGRSRVLTTAKARQRRSTLARRRRPRQSRLRVMRMTTSTQRCCSRASP